MNEYIVSGRNPEQNHEAAHMSTHPSVPPREFLLKQIENDINAAFVLVEKARKAYQVSQFAEGDSALANALKAHLKTMKQVSKSELDQVRGITHQMKELREAIDWLVESHVDLSKKPNR